MREVDAWLEALTEDTLQIERVHDDVTRALFQPCARTVEAVTGADRSPLRLYARPLAEFDERNNHVTLYPLNTRPGTKFLREKYPLLEQIVVEMEGPIAVDTPEQAEAVFEDLPDGFIKDWRWGLGLHKPVEPIVHVVRQSEIRGDQDPLEAAFGRPRLGRSLRLTRQTRTHIATSQYVLALSDFHRLRRSLLRIQKDHRERGLAERLALTHNTLLADLDPLAYPRQAAVYKPDTIYKMLRADGQPPRLSRQDGRALAEAVGERAKTLAREAPEALSAMVAAVQVANLDHLVERFQVLFTQPRSTEADWQALLSQNPFLLSLVFGYPVVLVQEQAGVGGSDLEGRDARFADFLLKNPVTNSAALVELKRPETVLIGMGSYAGVRQVGADLIQAVMQVLDQRHRLLTHLKFHQADGHEIEGWHVSCVVIAGRDPQDKDERKALELYRQSLKDVVVLTYGELLARLVGLRDFLASPAGASEPIAE
ncbi:Shedu immune nuclease family protein [Caulobacter sp. RHG1]|uniref:Shedu immune nuclease family protein n=1 Tax=Caulobacter sp. (strain RHG1) TaxID=2545762 RepID=UPI0015542D5C|nr:Shedu immune nuclease family protein [Caulobacter sp. RHG1]NQE61520.1 hypothetical protein [Caulobacter sp. RHG1]